MDSGYKHAGMTGSAVGMTSVFMLPSYLNLLKSDELAKRAGRAFAMMKKCNLCPRNCGVNRLKNEKEKYVIPAKADCHPRGCNRGSRFRSPTTAFRDDKQHRDDNINLEKGFCKTGKIAGVASANLHFGEEPPITGDKGSGTIFFNGCNLRCRFCQNFPISQIGHGKPSTPQRLAKLMLNLQKRGAHNINLVTPSHVVAQFLAALTIAAKNGLKIPIVYNSSGYEGIEALKLLDGVVDIYMPDIKYATRDAAARCSDAPDYWDVVRPAIKEMYAQVGALQMDDEGIAKKGLLIRHLVLPGNLASSEKVFEFVATEISKDVPVNLMSQYFPADRALEDILLNRKITKEEFAQAEASLHKWGLDNGWIQDPPENSKS